nr:hypothetical protein [Bacteroidota bacterium]
MGRVKLVNKRERWGCTIWAWLLFVVLLALLFVGFVSNIVSFLSAEDTIDAKILIVEGYVPDYAFSEVMRIFNDDNYDLLIAAGASYDQGFYISGIETAAHLIYRSLVKLGFDTTRMAMAPNPPGVFRDRTYYTALMTKKYIQSHLQDVDKVNIISLGTHSRRSRYLYRLVYEPDIQLGNIVIPDRVLNSKNWYKSSRGFRTVLNETLGFIYVRCAFSPPDTIELSQNFTQD